MMPTDCAAASSAAPARPRRLSLRGLRPLIARLHLRLRQCRLRRRRPLMARPLLLRRRAAQAALGFLTTLIVTVSAAVSATSTSGGSGDGSGDGQPAAAAAFGGMSAAQQAFYVVTIVLPALLSIVSSLRQDLNYAPKIVALRHAAAEVLSETYKFRARAGGYGDRSLAWEERPAGDGGGDDSGDCTVHDTISARAAKLTRKLVEVSARIDSFNRPDAPPSEKAPQPGAVPAAGWWCGARRGSRVHTEGGAAAGAAGSAVPGAARRGVGANDVEDVAALAKKLGLGGAAGVMFRRLVEECDKERRLGASGLSGDESVRVRLAAGKADCEREADGVERHFLMYRVSAYVLGALGSILSLLRFEARRAALIFLICK
jgi:hypothetical protein